VPLSTAAKTPLRVNEGTAYPPGTRPVRYEPQLSGGQAAGPRLRRMRGHARHAVNESPAQGPLSAWSVKPSRKLQWFESTTRHTPSERPLTCVNAVRGRSPLSPTVTGRLRPGAGICGQCADRNASMINAVARPRHHAWPPRCGGGRSSPGRRCTSRRSLWAWRRFTTTRRSTVSTARGAPPRHPVDGVGDQQANLDGVAQRVVEDRALARHHAGCGRLAVELPGQGCPTLPGRVRAHATGRQRRSRRS